MSVATATDLHLADMDLAMEAFRKTDTPGRRAASGAPSVARTWRV